MVVRGYEPEPPHISALKHRYWDINIRVAQVISIIEIASVQRRHECVGRSSEEKNKKKFLNLTIVKSVELFDFTPNEKVEKKSKLNARERIQNRIQAWASWTSAARRYLVANWYVNARKKIKMVWEARSVIYCYLEGDLNSSRLFSTIVMLSSSVLKLCFTLSTSVISSSYLPLGFIFPIFSYGKSMVMS